MIDNKKSCKRWCLQDFSSSPSWARTNNPTVNSRVLYHWAIEDYSVFLHFFFGVRPCRCSTIELSRIILFSSVRGHNAALPLSHQRPPHLQSHKPVYPGKPIQPLQDTPEGLQPGQALGLLVAVNSAHCCAPIPALSTLCSPRGLTPLGWEAPSWGGLHA